MLDSTGVAQYPWAHGEVLTAAALNAAIAQSTGASTGPTAPDSPSVGTIWYNTATGTLSVWDGSYWQPIAVTPGSDVSGATVRATGSTIPRIMADRAADVHNILDYGAVSDAQTATTACTMAAGSTTLTVGTAIFASGDVGKIIGVGTVAAPWLNPWQNYATITGFISSASVQCSASPFTGGSGAFGALTGQTCSVVWGTDCYSALNAAAQACSTNGGMVYVPSGQYVYGRTVYLYSNTTVRGDGPASVLFNAGIYGSQSDGATGSMLLNVNAVDSNGHFKKGNIVSLPTTPANQIDHDITIRDLFFNNAGHVSGGAAKCVCFALARNIRVLNNRFDFSGVTGSAISMIGCDNVFEEGNIATNTSIAHDHWGACTRVWIRGNSMTMVPGGPQAINFNAVGSMPSDVGVSQDLVCRDNSITLNGTCTAILLDGLAPGSVTRRCEIVNNTIIANSGTGNTGIVHRGNGGRDEIHGNALVGLDGQPILTGAIMGSSVSLTNPLTVSNGSTTGTLVFPVHGLYAAGVTNGIWVKTPAVTVGGVVLSGGFNFSALLPVLSIVDANTLTVQLPSAATSSTTGGGTANWNIHFGFVDTVEIASNLIVNPTYTGSLIEATGNNIVAGPNRVAPISGAPTYASIVNIGVYDVAAATAVTNQYGPAGSGPTGGQVGNGTVTWLTAYRPKFVELATDTTGLVTLPAGIVVGPPGVTIGGALAANTSSGALFTAGDTGASPLPFSTSYRNGASSGALTVFGVNVHYDGAGSLQRFNTTKSAWYYGVDNRDGAVNGSLVLTEISAGGGVTAAATFDSAGGLSMFNQVAAAFFRQGASGPTWTSGAGAPATTQPVGSFYSNTSGTTGSRLYVSAGGGTWNAVAGV